VQKRIESKTGLPCWRIEPFLANRAPIDAAESLLSPLAERFPELISRRMNRAVAGMDDPEAAEFEDRVDIYLSELLRKQEK